MRRWKTVSAPFSRCLMDSVSRSTTQRTFFKDLQQLCRTIEASTDGQAAIAGSEEMSVRVLLRPKSGCNAHAEFTLNIKCTSYYPRDPPEVTFGSPIFHSNIDTATESICLSFFSDCYSLLDVVKAVLYLIEHPRFASVNNSLGMLENPRQSPSKTVRLLAGLLVKEYRFAPNTAWCEWARVNGCLPTREEEEDETEEFGAEVKERTVAMEDKLSEYGPANNLTTVISAEDAALDDEESSLDVCDEISIATSDTVPSFAKIRHSIDVQDVSQIWNLHELKYIPCDIAFQRVLIWEPDSCDNPYKNSVFYFAGILGGYHHRNEMGLLYRTLFAGNVLKENQIHSDSRQTSGTCPWFPSFTNPYPSFCSIQQIILFQNSTSAKWPRALQEVLQPTAK
ncbi:Ubiquitin-conjugating enzyme E2 PEX4, partial [Taenia solium]